MVKKTYTLETKRSREVVKLYELRILADYIIEDLDCEDIKVYVASDLERAYLKPIYCSEKISTIYIRELLSNLDLFQWNSANLIIADSDYSNIDLYAEEISMDRVLQRLAGVIIKDLNDNFESFVYDTYKLGIEHLFILHRRGYWVVLEGERYRVTIPKINDVIASIHTHPKGSCLPSREDLENMIDLLTNGGILFGIASLPCMFSAELIDFLDEDTYEKLIYFLNNYYEFTKSLMMNPDKDISLGDKLILKIRYGIYPL